MAHALVRIGDPAGGTFNGRSGGRGGANTTLPTNGETYDGGLTRRGGGGGGAVGVIEVRATVSSTVGAIVSPPAKMSVAVVE
ncbi:MAG: hypothetical protein WKG01_01240 [Kofleriaceae bacterium]